MLRDSVLHRTPLKTGKSVAEVEVEEGHRHAAVLGHCVFHTTPEVHQCVSASGKANSALPVAEKQALEMAPLRVHQALGYHAAP